MNDECLRKIDELKQELFLLDMKDHLTPDDFTRRSEIMLEMRDLENDDKSSRIF